jgi:hypothetical protein
VTTVEAGAKGAGTVSRVSSASPTAIFESSTTSQWSFRYVPEECRDVRLGGVRDRRHADDLQAQGAGVHRHLHGEGVAPGEGDDHEYVAGAGRAAVEDGARQAVDPFQRGAQCRRNDVHADGARHGEQVHQREAARPVHEVLRGQRGVPGAEREEPSAVGDRVGDQRPGCLDGPGLLVPHPLQQADRGVEELPGQLAVAHARSPLSRSTPGRVADHVAVWTSAVSIRSAGATLGPEGPCSRPAEFNGPAVRAGTRHHAGFTCAARLSVGCVRIGARASAHAGEPLSLRQS